MRSNRFFILLIVFFALICLYFINFIFNYSQVSQNSKISTASSSGVLEQKTSPSKKPTSKNSTDSAKTQSVEAYHPVASGSELRVPILYYHYIGNNPNSADLQRNALSISPDKFEEQMKYLRDNGYTAVSLDTLAAALRKKATLPSKPVILTFDDGYIDFYYNAYPILLKFKLSATVFIPTGLANSSYYLTWPQIKEMQNSGLINYGSHTVHHYNLPSIPENTAFNELSESKKVLQDNLGVPINFISYPNGATNNFIVNLAQKAGYVGGVGTWANTYQSEETIYNMPRLRISGSLSLDNFAKLLQ